MAQKAKNPKADNAKGRFLKFFKDIKNELKKVICTKTNSNKHSYSIGYVFDIRCIYMGI